MRVTTTEGNDHIYTGRVAYDGYNNLKTFKEQVGTAKTAYQTAFTYDYENRPTDITFGNTSNKVSYIYDGVNRLTTRTVVVDGWSHPVNYTYVAGSHNGSNTTPLVASMTQGNDTVTYTYDDLGNICSVLRNGSVSTTYSYDSMNQLIRVDDQNDLTSGSSGTTWKYEYDRGGNIVSKKRYPFTIGPVGTALETIPCGYGDSNWKDKMTMYNYLAISYDAMGNPTNYNSWTYTWEKGRQLKQMSDGYWNVSYKYNADGQRFEKRSRAGSSSETVTKYTLHGKNIVHLTQDNHSMHFFYDAQNRPAIVEWNNGTTTAKYAYIHNLQGDVIACRFVKHVGQCSFEGQ